MLQFKRILTIDSHEDFRGYFCKMLRENFSAYVDEASSFLEMNAAMQQHVYDFIFIDMSFSDINSLTLTKRIANIMPNAAIILMSIHGGFEYRMASISSQALYFINKSNFIYEDFVLFLEGILNRVSVSDDSRHSLRSHSDRRYSLS